VPHPDDHDPLLGRVIDGRFTLQSVLGRGGMGVVYRAVQASLERPIALKILTGVDDPVRDAEFQQRFFLEAATAARLRHPNTITVFDYGSDVVDGTRLFFIAMELLEGETLSRFLQRHAPLAPSRAVHIATQVARSLREAHTASVVHRDLKPGNIMVVRHDDDDGDFVKVLDFGLAKTHAEGVVGGLTRAGTFMGSPRYVAPEQIEGRPVDLRADIYSFGCVLYRMLTGRVPFDGTQPVEVMMKHLKDPVPALGVVVPPVLEKLVLDCLAKKAGDRPANMDAVLKSLRTARLQLGGEVTGFLVLSDEHAVIPPPEPEPTEYLPPPTPKPARVPTPAPMPVTSSTTATATSSASHEVVRDLPRAMPRPKPGADWRLATPLHIEDSTRPTRVLGRLTLDKAPPSPWAAIAFGAIVGITVVAGVIAWRLSPTHAPRPVAIVAPRELHVQVTSEPTGAAVVDVTSGNAVPLGVTPFSFAWSRTGESARTLDFTMVGKRTAHVVLHAPQSDVVTWVDAHADLVDGD
jgi:serine/threonine-protein kinase